MSLAQPKSGELLDLLGPSLTTGENLLSEFEIHQIIREAKKIPEYYQSLSIQGLAKIIRGDIEEGCTLCEESLRFAPNDTVAFCNYIIALRKKGYHAKQHEVLCKATNSNNPVILSEIAVHAAFWLDIDLLRKVMPILDTMEVEKIGDLSISDETLSYLEEYAVHSQSFKAIGNLMMSIADRYHLRLSASNPFYNFNELFALFIEFVTDDLNLLSQVNNDLTNEILVAGLENSECIGCFQVGDL